VTGGGGGGAASGGGGGGGANSGGGGGGGLGGGSSVRQTDTQIGTQASSDVMRDKASTAVQPKRQTEMDGAHQKQLEGKVGVNLACTVTTCIQTQQEVT
jgi:hypothetical protein